MFIFPKNFVLLCGLIFSSFNSQAASSLKHCPASTSQFRLSSGEVIDLPLCADSTKYSSVIAYTDLTATNALLKPLRMYAVPVGGKALTFLAAVNYQASALGPYREFIVGVMASPTPDLKGGLFRFLEFFKPSAPTTHNIVVLKLWVDSPLALRTGNEIWSFNKNLATITMPDSGGFEVKDESGQLIARSDWSRSFQVLLPFGQNWNFYTMSVGGRTAESHYEGNAHISEFGKSDQVSFGSSEWGRVIQALSPQPSLKWSAENLALKLYAPQQPSGSH